MGLGGISIWQLLIILAIVVMVFGTKRLRNIGGDLGSAIKSFRKGLSEDEQPAAVEDQSSQAQTIADEEESKVGQEK